MPNNVKIKFIFLVSIFILLSIACSQKVDRYIQDLKSKNSRVRWRALKALSEIKDPRSVPPLIALLKEYVPVQRHMGEAQLAMSILGEIKDPRAVPVLIEALEVENFEALEGANLWSRICAIQALGEIKDPRAAPALIEALKERRFQFNAVQALGKIKDPMAAPFLIEVLKDRRSGVRWEAARALREMGPEAAEKALNICVENLTDWHSNDSVVKILFDFGWKPQSEQDKIHHQVALRNRGHLEHHWKLAKKVLLKDLESSEYCTIENALLSFMGIGKKEIIPVLIKKLEQKGNKTMAEAYLNCGQKELKEAARNWAARHGYKISSGRGAYPVKWGRM